VYVSAQSAWARTGSATDVDNMPVSTRAMVNIEKYFFTFCPP